MASVADAKSCGKQFSNGSNIIKVTYDFAADGGATGDLTLLTADSDCVVHLKHAAVKTTCTSGGSATFDLGKGTSGNEMVNDKAVAALTAEVCFIGAAPVQLSAGEIVNLQIDTAAFTAGKIDFVFEVLKY